MPLTLNQLGDVLDPTNPEAVNAKTHDVVLETEFQAFKDSFTTAPDPINPSLFKAAGSVSSTGAVQQIAGATVARLSQGRYQITFNSAANTATYPVLATMEGLPQNDDYQWAYLSRTVNSFIIEVREQDNGITAGVLRDSGFSFFVPII